jgi:hypothetical protein
VGYAMQTTQLLRDPPTPHQILWQTILSLD